MPSTLVTQVADDPVALVVDATDLYYAAANYVDYCPLAGCGLLGLPFTHVASASTTSVTSIAEIPAMAELFLTWTSTDSDGGTSAALSGKPTGTTAGFPTEITSSPITPGALTVCGGALCWVASFASASAVLSCPPGGCSTGPDGLYKRGVFFPQTLAYDGTLLYFTDATNIYSVDPSNPQPPVTVAQRSGVSALAWSAGHLFWLEQGTTTGQVMQCTLPQCDTSYVTLAGPGVPNLNDIAVDGENVYWTVDRDPGEIDSCAVGGCGNHPRIVAGQLHAPHDLVLDANKLYWAASTGSTHDIEWVAK
jgi:hypothetical protein